MTITSRQLDSIVAGLLSVNSYRVEAAWELIPRLREEGLLDPKTVIAMDTREVARRLVAAGYNRGGITDILAPRVRALMSSVSDGELDRLPDVLQQGDRQEFARLLLRLSGVGPKVVDTVWLLIGDPGAQ